jgi:hypothetical protein
MIERIREGAVPTRVCRRERGEGRGRGRGTERWGEGEREVGWWEGIRASLQAPGDAVRNRNLQVALNFSGSASN